MGQFTEGEIVSAESMYYGGIEGASIFAWYRKQTDGELVTIQEGSSKEYKLTLADVHNEMVISYTPVRNDDVQGATKSFTSARVQAAKPTLSQVTIVSPSFCECETISTSASYFGGHEKARNHKWICIKADDSNEEIATSAEYVIGFADVGHCIQYSAQPISEEDAGEWYYSNVSPVITARMFNIEISTC